MVWEVEVEASGGGFFKFYIRYMVRYSLSQGSACFAYVLFVAFFAGD